MCGLPLQWISKNPLQFLQFGAVGSKFSPTNACRRWGVGGAGSGQGERSLGEPYRRHFARVCDCPRRLLRGAAEAAYVAQEILRLSWKENSLGYYDVHLKEIYVKVHGKGDRESYVPLGDLSRPQPLCHRVPRAGPPRHQERTSSATRRPRACWPTAATSTPSSASSATATSPPRPATSTSSTATCRRRYAPSAPWTGCSDGSPPVPANGDRVQSGLYSVA